MHCVCVCLVRTKASGRPASWSSRTRSRAPGCWPQTPRAAAPYTHKHQQRERELSYDKRHI